MRFILLVAVLLVICISPATFADDSDVLRLSCKITNPFKGDTLDVPVEVYIKQKTANGFRAEITDSTISWTSGSIKWNINRYTGAVVLLGEPSTSGTCVKTREKAF